MKRKYIKPIEYDENGNITFNLTRMYKKSDDLWSRYQIATNENVSTSGV